MNEDMKTKGMRELAIEELSLVAGAAAKPKPKPTVVICNTVRYDDGTSVRTCKPEK